MRPTMGVQRDLLWVSKETYYSTLEPPYRVASDSRKGLAPRCARAPNSLQVCGFGFSFRRLDLAVHVRQLSRGFRKYVSEGVC